MGGLTQPSASLTRPQMSVRNRAGGSTTNPATPISESDKHMTQQPYPPQGYPAPQPQQYPPQQYPPQPYYPPAPAPGYPPQGYQQPPQQPQAPVVAGTLSDFYNQPVGGGGPGISWKGKAEGTTYRGIISGNCPVQQDIDFDSKQPKFQKDGVTPKWVMQIPLAQVQTNHQGPPEFPDGEAVFYVRGLAKDELARAMAEAGCSGEPKEGAVFQVTLTRRKPNRTGNPSNIVAIVYSPPNGVPHNDAPAAPAAPAPVQEAPAQPAAPVQPQAPQGLPPLGAPPAQQQAPAPLPPMGAPPAQQQAPAPLPPMGAPPQQAAPQGPPPEWAQPPVQQVQQQGQPPLQAPPGMDPAQAALIQQLGGQVAQG